MKVLRAVAFAILVTIFGQACNRSDVSGQSTSIDSSGRQGGPECKNCYMLHALDRYLALPTRYAVRRSARDNCLVFTAPFSDVRKELGTSQFAERLRTASGLIRYCDRSVLDRDIEEIIEKAGVGVSQRDGDVTIRKWSPDAMKTPFTATYFALNDEGLLIFDVDTDFADRIWREGIRD